MFLSLFFFSSFSHSNCFKEVSDKYLINENLLRAIVYVESRGNKDATNCLNSNESCDFGFAQINLSEWKDELETFGISILDLQDPCQNLHFGAWILAKNFESHGRNWTSVGAYNAGFKKKHERAREIYINLIKERLSVLEKQAY